MNTPAAIKRIRKSRKLTQVSLAEKVGITQHYLSQIETGNRVPSQKIIDKICSELNVPVAYLTFMSVERADVPESKQALYDALWPALASMFEEVVNEVLPKEKSSINQ